jgi:hypothetical protein
MKRIAQSALMFEEMIQKFPKTKIEVLNRLLDSLVKDMWDKKLLAYGERKISNEHDVGMGKLGQIEYKVTGFILSEEEMEDAMESLRVLKSFAPGHLKKDVDKLIEIFSVKA